MGVTGKRTYNGLAALASAVLIGGLILLAPAPAGALTVDVTTTADGGPGSLRAAVDAVNAAGAGPHVINLGIGLVYQLTDCGEGYLDVDEGPLTINGNGSTIEQTCAGERVLRYDPQEPLTINETTITGGDRLGNAGGIKSFGPVTVNDSTISGNRADANGGGIWTQDQDVIVNRSTIADNRADDNEDSSGAGGGIYAGAGRVTIMNSTVTGNWAELGGGVFADFIDPTLSTVVANSSERAGANINATHTMTAFGSVIAFPTGGINCANDDSVSLGYNYSTDASCDFFEVGDVDDGADPLLGALADNGGPTETMLPQPGSPLLDAIPSGDPTCTGTDQRGVPRPQVDGCDVGAVEVETEQPPVTTTTTTSTSTPTTAPPPAAAQPATGAQPAAAARPVAATPTFTG